jgi:hypothetical protein
MKMDTFPRFLAASCVYKVSLKGYKYELTKRYLYRSRKKVSTVADPEMFFRIRNALSRSGFRFAPKNVNHYSVPGTKRLYKLFVLKH